MFENIEFANPEFFWLLLLLPLALLWYFFKRKNEMASLRISSIKGFTVTSWASKLKPILLVIRLLALAAIITALARPQTEDISTRTKTTKGIDIVMAIDVSSSMLARDLKPDRLTALKEVAADFIEGRPNDRIGLVSSEISPKRTGRALRAMSAIGSGVFSFKSPRLSARKKAPITNVKAPAILYSRLVISSGNAISVP